MQAVFIHCSSRPTNIGVSQPAPTTSAPPPIGPHAIQQRDKNAGLQEASINTTTGTISSSSTISSSALGGSSSLQQPSLARAAALRTADSRPCLCTHHAPTPRSNATHRRLPTLRAHAPGAASWLSAELPQRRPDSPVSASWLSAFTRLSQKKTQLDPAGQSASLTATLWVLAGITSLHSPDCYQTKTRLQIMALFRARLRHTWVML
jgi:hypothetical protein